jgi:hypothetical protein
VAFSNSSRLVGMLVAIQMVLFGMAQDLLEFWMELYCFFKKIAGILVAI